MFRLDSSTNFELPKSEKVQIEIYHHLPYLEFARFEFNVFEDKVEGKVLQASRSGGVDILDVLLEFLNYLSGNLDSISFINLKLIIKFKNITVETDDAFGNFERIQFYSKDLLSGDSNLLNPNEKLASYFHNLVDRIYCSLDEANDEMNQDQLLYKPLDEYEGEVETDTGGDVGMWIRHKKDFDGEFSEYTQEELIQICLEYILEQIRIDSVNFQIDRFEWPTLTMLIKKIIERAISQYGNTIAAEANKLDKLAHDFVIYLDNLDIDSQDHWLYDEYWNEIENPRTQILKLIDDRDDLFMTICDEITNIGIFFSNLNPNDIDEDDEGGDPSPYEPIKV